VGRLSRGQELCEIQSIPKLIDILFAENGKEPNITTNLSLSLSLSLSCSLMSDYHFKASFGIDAPAEFSDPERPVCHINRQP
jgi:hypothetical protein